MKISFKQTLIWAVIALVAAFLANSWFRGHSQDSSTEVASEAPSENIEAQLQLSFEKRVEVFFATQLNVAPEDFHDVMGKELFLKRYSQAEDAEAKAQHDYEQHLALALHILELKPKELVISKEALESRVIGELEAEHIWVDFQNQKAAVLNIRDVAQMQNSLPEGALPQGEGLGLNLSAADKGYYGKIFVIPPHIGSLNKITKLLLGYNSLLFLPPEIGQLEKMQDIELIDNKLRMLPKELLNLKELKILSIKNMPDLMSDQQAQEILTTLRQQNPGIEILE